MVYKCNYCGRRFNVLKWVKRDPDDIAVCPFCGYDDFEKTQEYDEE